MIGARNFDPVSGAGGWVTKLAMRAAVEQLASVFLPTMEQRVVVQRDVVDGVLDEELVSYARMKKADLIVMGTRGRSGILRLALGSAAQRVLRFAHCPVVMVARAIALRH